jgi:hypothetical protein
MNEVQIGTAKILLCNMLFMIVLVFILSIWLHDAKKEGQVCSDSKTNIGHYSGIYYVVMAGCSIGDWASTEIN